MKNQKKTFTFILIILSISLVFLPVVTTFNNVLAKFVLSNGFFRVIQDFIVPWEIRMVGVILYPFGLSPKIAGDYLMLGGEKPFLIEIAWNCIGWQSIIFFVLTAWVGFQGDAYNRLSKIKAWTFGLLGTFLINLFRISFVAVVAFKTNQKVALLFHDYASSFLVVIWLIFYWWFVYSFILESKVKLEVEN